jgi:large subunit ribosomal protein L35Ae
MKGVIANFRSSRHRQTDNQMILKVEGISSKDKATALVGKTVTWLCPGKNKKPLKGKITGAHGNSGAVKALFETGMPGQCLSKEVLVE